MRNYSSKLLFQWNPIKNGKEYRKKRVCEERIYTYTAKTDKNALTKAKKIGKENQLQHEIEGGVVKFEFVGVLELIELMDQDEVWYQLIDKVTKNNSFKHLIPNESELDVFKKIPKGKPKAW